MKRILLSIPEDLLAAIDHEARAYYMTRSDLVRRALIHYLQPAVPSKCADDARERTDDIAVSNSKADSLYTDPEELYKIIHHQKMRAGIRALVYDMKKKPSNHKPGN